MPPWRATKRPARTAEHARLVDDPAPRSDQMAPQRLGSRVAAVEPRRCRRTAFVLNRWPFGGRLEPRRAREQADIERPKLGRPDGHCACGQCEDRARLEERHEAVHVGGVGARYAQPVQGLQYSCLQIVSRRRVRYDRSARGCARTQRSAGDTGGDTLPARGASCGARAWSVPRGDREREPVD